MVNSSRTGWKRTALLAALCGFALCVRAQPPDLIVEAELTPAQVYVGGEARLLLRLLRAPGVTHGALRPPVLGEAADISLLGQIHNYETERSGVLYDVLERTHVIVPRQAGRLVVPGAEFEGALNYEVYNRATGTTARTARGPQRVLEVIPPPAGAVEPWLPARGLTLEESWSHDLDTLSSGTPVTRTIILRAEGIAAQRLPKLEMPAHPALIVHHDQPELATEYLPEGMAGRRVQRIVLMPVAEAEVALPALSVPWWDIGADQPRTATIPARTLRLHGAIAPAAVPQATPVSVSTPVILKWSLAAIVLLVALSLWWYVRTMERREARRRLRAACRRNDARAARDALIELSKAVTPKAPPLPVHRIGAAWPDAHARAQLGALDAALYAGREWDGKAFWRSVRPWLRKRAPRRTAPRPSSLPPLYRLQARAPRPPAAA